MEIANDGVGHGLGGEIWEWAFMTDVSEIARVLWSG
jgi:hypothetical protein